MKHPAPEELMTLLYGEASGQEKKELTRHLNECAECRRQMAQWRGTMECLDEMPAPATRRRSVPAPVRWLAAAAMLIGLGIVVGQFAFVTDDATLRAGLRAEMDQRVAAMRAELTRDFEQRQEVVLAQITAAADAKISAQAEKLAGDFSRTLDATRAADREVYLTAMKELDEKRQEQVGALRKDLEAVVTLADYGFEATQQRLAQLASFTQTTPQE
jgi:hypothetical protein